MHLLPGHPKCGVPHGHTYKVEVVVEGPIKNGMVVDFDVLKRATKEILGPLDHTDLNKILPMPSCENICVRIHSELSKKMQGMDRIAVRVWEGDGKYAEFDGR